MNKTQYTLTALCFITITLFACKHKTKTLNEAVKAESEARSDTGTIAASSVNSNKLIVAGKSIGHTALNEPTNNAITALGKPDMADAAMGKSVSVWYDGHNKNGYTTHIYTSTDMGNDNVPRIKLIRVSAPSFKTQNHLYTGMLIPDAQKLYKLQQLGNFKLNGSNRTLYDDIAAGIAFDTDRSGTITGIGVHEPGKNALNAYMAFFGEVKSGK